MKLCFYAFAMCQSMFCAIPFPCKVWEEKARDKMLLFLPLVGLEIGLLWGALGWLCRFWNLPQLVTGLVLCIWPYLATGFLHLDGFMDVTDAVKSWRDLERRREILKDSHVGSFSVIACILLVVSQFAFFSSAEPEGNLWILTLVPVVSRCCGALAVTILPPMSTSQYAKRKCSVSHIVILLTVLAAALALGFGIWGRYGFVLLGAMAGFLLALTRAYRSLKGMNGDIAGYAITFSELAAAAVLAIF